MSDFSLGTALDLHASFTSGRSEIISPKAHRVFSFPACRIGASTDEPAAASAANTGRFFSHLFSNRGHHSRRRFAARRRRCGLSIYLQGISGKLSWLKRYSEPRTVKGFLGASRPEGHANQTAECSTDAGESTRLIT